jgi:hypothetical protein
MRYRERSPSAILQPFVECIWTLNGAAREVVAQPERILPDGCMELIFHRGKPFRRRGELQPHCFVVGQMIEPAFLQVSTRIEVVGIRFRPGGAYPFLMFPMHELTHRFISVAEVGAASEESWKKEFLAHHRPDRQCEWWWMTWSGD